MGRLLFQWDVSFRSPGLPFGALTSPNPEKATSGPNPKATSPQTPFQQPLQSVGLVCVREYHHHRQKQNSYSTRTIGMTAAFSSTTNNSTKPLSTEESLATNQAFLKTNPWQRSSHLRDDCQLFLGPCHADVVLKFFRPMPSI